MVKKTLFFLVASVLLLFVFAVEPTFSFEIDTHRMLNLLAINQPVAEGNDTFYLDSYLFRPLEFNIWEQPWGRNGNITWRMVQEWIKEGGASEDDFPRYLNHSHDPLRPWDGAGIRILGYPFFSSSIVWAQEEKGTQYSGAYSWHDAREYYYKALSGATSAERLEWFQKTFRALGQIMHLVEDAAVPDHTRNDYWHGPRAYFLNSSTFERWTDANLEMVSSLPVSTFTKEQVDQIFGEEGDAPAPVPISRLFDMNLYLPGARPSITGQSLAGIAEYSNSNFLSYATIFKTYAYPSLESTEPLPGGSYLQKVRDGEAIDHLVRFRRFDEKITYSLDAATYRDYASLILPKAATYASLVPYYFFRASLQIQVDYNCWTPEIPPVIHVFNDSSEMMDGELDLYALSIENGNQSLLGTFAINNLPPCTKEFGWWCMGPPYESIVVSPGAGYTGFVIAVFRGTLGLEKDAVVASDWAGGCTN